MYILFAVFILFCNKTREQIPSSGKAIEKTQMITNQKHREQLNISLIKKGQLSGNKKNLVQINKLKRKTAVLVKSYKY